MRIGDTVHNSITGLEHTIAWVSPDTNQIAFADGPYKIYKLSDYTITHHANDDRHKQVVYSLINHQDPRGSAAQDALLQIGNAQKPTILTGKSLLGRTGPHGKSTQSQSQSHPQPKETSVKGESGGESAPANNPQRESD